MKNNSLFLLLIILTTVSCRVNESENDQPTDAHTDVPVITSTFEQVIESSPMGTKVPTCTATSEPTLITGSMSRQELEEQIQNWISGDIPFSDGDRLYDERIGKKINLNILSNDPLNGVIFVFYDLGFIVIKDSNGKDWVINLVGFEDPQGERFTFVFHNGELESTCQILYLRIYEGNGINNSLMLSSDEYSPEIFLQRSDEMIGFVTTSYTLYKPEGSTGDECVNYVNEVYIPPALETVNALIDFFECKECSLDEIPETLVPWVNTIPEEFDPTIPYLRFYDVSDW